MKFDAEYIARRMKQHKQWQIAETERLVQEIFKEARKSAQRHEDASMERTYEQR